jgi:phenylpyruvate tautomerase PptA (4-oxalocrotonate tautomerase family)
VPIIEMKAFEQRFEDPAIADELIKRLTEAVASVYGEDVARETWVLLEGHSPAHWGFGGSLRV